MNTDPAPRQCLLGIWGLCGVVIGIVMQAGPKTIIIPFLLFKNDIFPPLAAYGIVFLLLLCAFCPNSSLFCTYNTLLLSIFSISFPFLPFSFTYLSFFSSPFHISPQMTSVDIPSPLKWHLLIFPLPGGGGGARFQYIEPCMQVRIFQAYITSCRQNVMEDCEVQSEIRPSMRRDDHIDRVQVVQP
jgi:hypothetical protein